MEKSNKQRVVREGDTEQESAFSYDAGKGIAKKMAKKSSRFVGQIALHNHSPNPNSKKQQRLRAEQEAKELRLAEKNKEVNNA